MSKRLVVDGQLFQTPALHRGMGKYTNELLGSLIEQNSELNKWDRIDIVYSSEINDAEGFIQELGEWSKQVHFLPLHLLLNVPGSRKVVDHNRDQIDKFMEGIKGDRDFFIPGIFQSEIAPVFPSIPNCRNILLMHDLIPLAFHDTYLKSPGTQREYLTKVSEVFKADIYVTVSKTVANDLSMYLGIDKNRISFIGGGPISHGQDVKKIDVPKPFVLMPTGNDMRKNNHKGILGFDGFNEANGDRYHLVITSFFQEHEIIELNNLADKIIFTGNISGEELNYLYQEASALLFPSEYEGLGLPILEAAERGKPVACSDIPVFREMSESAFQYFNYRDTVDIAAKLESAVNSKPQTTKYKSILKDFSWPETAQRLIKVLEKTSEKTVLHRPKVRLYVPDPETNSAAGRIGQMLAAELSRYVDLAAATSSADDPFPPRRNYLKHLYPFKIYDSLFAQPNDNRLPIYILGNAPADAEIMCRALAEPGILILLSTELESLWSQAIHQGLMTQSRLDLEKEINDKLSAGCLLASLLSKQQAVGTFDKKDEALVESILTLVQNSHCRVTLLDMPTFELPYPGVMPDKLQPSCTPNVEQTDRERLIELSRSRELEIPKDLQLNLISRLDAVALGNSMKKESLITTTSFRMLAEMLASMVSNSSGSKL